MPVFTKEILLMWLKNLGVYTDFWADFNGLN